MNFELKFGGDGLLVDLQLSRERILKIIFIWCGSLQQEFLTFFLLAF